MFKILATLAVATSTAEAFRLRTSMQKKMKMCLKARMESQMCKSAVKQPEISAAVQVLKGVRDACAHCREYQCSPGLCYAGPCPQGIIDPNVNPDCLSSDYCWNPAPVSVKGSRYRLCFAKATEGGHGLSIRGGKVVADASSAATPSSVPNVSAALVSQKTTVSSSTPAAPRDDSPMPAPSMAPVPSMAHYNQQMPAASPMYLQQQQAAPAYGAGYQQQQAQGYATAGYQAPPRQYSNMYR